MNKTQIATIALLLLGFVAAFAISRAAAQGNSASWSSTQNAPLTWKRVVRLHDGRTFVSDGAIALAVELAKPPAPPSHDVGESGAMRIEGYLNAELTNEFAVSQLARRGDVYVALSGVTLNPVYVDYLRRTLPEARLRFRMKGPLEPVVIVLDGKAVGLLMPMKSANP